mmetsp:Transcript_31121/g.45525  ORF Transcript_31121/g.45525 Transcript_31121/m.45525 type:complete len:132 (-) Transcript_31121:2697-3092(-)
MNLQLYRSHAHVSNIISRRINYRTILTKPPIENRTSQWHFRNFEDAAGGVRILIGAMIVENSCLLDFSFTPRSTSAVQLQSPVATTFVPETPRQDESYCHCDNISQKHMFNSVARSLNLQLKFVHNPGVTF